MSERKYYEVFEFKGIGNRVVKRKRVPTMSKEDVKRAIEFRNPPRIPVWFDWFAKETEEKYGDDLRELLNEFPDDIMVITYEEPDWGVKTVHSMGGVGERIRTPVLERLDKLDWYLSEKFPDPHIPGSFDQVERIVKDHRDKFIVGYWSYFIFERMHLLRGMENLLCDLYLHKREVEILGERLLEYYIEIMKKFSQLGVDAIFTTEDWGTQEHLLINPKTWRAMFKPWYRIFIEEVHKQGLFFILHSCGNITEIIPDLIEIGVDVIHPIQPNAMDRHKIAKEFLGKICFFAGIDVQHVLPQGTPAQVENEIKDIIDTFYHPEGGLMITVANSVMPETPFENIVAMCESLKKYAWRQ